MIALLSQIFPDKLNTADNILQPATAIYLCHFWCLRKDAMERYGAQWCYRSG